MHFIGNPRKGSRQLSNRQTCIARGTAASHLQLREAYIPRMSRLQSQQVVAYYYSTARASEAPFDSGLRLASLTVQVSQGAFPDPSPCGEI
jgi:hypothetical protein